MKRGGPAKSMTTNSEYEEIMAELSVLRGHSVARALEDNNTTPRRESEAQTTPQNALSPLDDATNTYTKQNGKTQAENSKGETQQQPPPRSSDLFGQASNGQSTGESVEKIRASLEQYCQSHPMEGALAGSTDLPEEIQHALVKYQRAKKLLSHQIQESEKMGELLSKERNTNAELRLRLDSKIALCEDAVKEGLSAINERVKHDKEHMEHLKQGLGLSEMGKMAAVKELHKCQCELKATKEALADLELVKTNLLSSVEQKHKELVSMAKEEAIAMEGKIRDELQAEFSAKEHLVVKEARAEADKLRKDLQFIQESIRVRVFGMLEGLQNEACTVQEMVDRWDQWVADLTRELSEEREKRLECQDECQELKAAVEDYERKEWRNDLQGLKNEATMLLIDKTHLIGENAKLQQRVSILENKNAHIENCWKESREQSRIAERKFLTLKRCLEEVSAADPPDDVTRELNATMEELMVVKRERNEAVARFEQGRERQSGLETCARELEEELRKLTVAGQAEISALNDRLENTEREATEQKMLLQTKCESLENALARERQQGSSSSGQNDLQGCVSNLQAASQELNSVQEGLGKVLPTTETIREIASHVIRQAEAVAQQFQSEVNEAKSNFEEVDRNFTLKKLECRNLEARLGEAHRKLRIQDEVIIRQNEELHKLKEDVQTGADLAYEVVTVREKCDMLKSTIERLDREILEEREEVLMLCRANTNLQNDLADANHALEEAERKLACHERRRRRDDRPPGSGNQHLAGNRSRETNTMPSGGGPVSSGLARQGRMPGMLSPVGSLEAISSESGHRSDRASSSTASTEAFRPPRDNQRGARMGSTAGGGSDSSQPGTSQVTLEESSSSSTDVSSLLCWADVSARVSSFREEGRENADGGISAQSTRPTDR